MILKKKKDEKRNANTDPPEQTGLKDQDDYVRLFPLNRSPETHLLEAFLPK